MDTMEKNCLIDANNEWFEFYLNVFCFQKSLNYDISLYEWKVRGRVVNKNHDFIARTKLNSVHQYFFLQSRVCLIRADISRMSTE